MTGTQYLVLGPLTVRSGGTVVALPPGKQRAVLAALLLRANQVVSVEELAETTWGTDPPASARVGVQNYVMRLRKSLRAAGADIGTEPGGYVLRVDADDVDLTRFERLIRAARSAARDGDWPAAAERAAAALQLWRGEPLADVSSEPLSAREAPRLAELRLHALATGLEADLQLGRHSEVIGDLQRLVGLHPLRENLHGLLMLALYRDGRPAEALAAYQQARAVLVEELGAEPGPDLQRLHQQILGADPALNLPESITEVGADAANVPGVRLVMVPRELPAPVAHFIGRAAELDELDRLLLAGQAATATPTAAVISAVSGTPGVGKTALAIHWAQRGAGEFPDGQLYVNLRGYDPEQPVAAADALAGFLRSMGVPSQDIPAEAEERAARYRSLLAGRRVLVVLDNAGSVQQVRPLLPGSPACAVVVTSRDSLAGLVARDGATRVDLDLLPMNEAVALLRELIGPRAEIDPLATQKLAERCARLPLALRIAAELALARPDVGLAELVAELADQQRRLDLLDAGGDSRTDVRAVFSWSYRNLDLSTARAFRLIGLHPGPDYDAYAVAALTSAGLDQARRNLDALLRAHLIQPASPGRYAMHDLLHSYAREQAAAQDAADERHQAAMRLFDYYLSTAATATQALYPARENRRPTTPASSAPVTDAGAAMTWLNSERACFAAMATHEAREGRPGHTIQLSATLSRFLEAGGHYPEAFLIHAQARDAARRAGDRAAQAAAVNCIGVLHRKRADYDQAAAHLEQARVLFREAGDLIGEARALHNLGNIYIRQGRYDQAANGLNEALIIFRDMSDKRGEALTLDSLGGSRQLQGRYQQAGSHLRRALALHREVGDVDGEAYALTNLSIVYERQGSYEDAAVGLQQALILFRRAGDRSGEATALNELAAAQLRLGDLGRAASSTEEALTLSRVIGDRSSEADALNMLGDVLLASGEPGQARSRYSQAMGLAEQIDEKHHLAHGHNGIAKCHHASGELSQSREHWQQALAIYTELGMPEADEVRALLADADGEPQATGGSAI